MRQPPNGGGPPPVPPKEAPITSIQAAEPPPTVRPARSVLVVDDHAVFGEALALALAAYADFGEIRTARGIADALATLDEGYRPDLAIVDLRLGDGDGIDLATGLRLRTPETRVVLLTAHPSPAVTARAADTGVQVVLPKGLGLKPLVAHLLDTLGAPTPPPPAGLPVPALTLRETEILHLLADGHDVRGVARELSISPHTVRDHVKSAREKLGVHSQLEAVVAAFRRGLIELRG